MNALRACSLVAALAVAVITMLALRAFAQLEGGTTARWRLPGAIGLLSSQAPLGYAGSSACAGCHQAQAEAWSASHHAFAMALAEPATVRGDFSGVSVEHLGSRGRFFRDGEHFMVETEGRDGKPSVYAVSHTFGIEPLQQYLVTFPDGRVQALPWAWDARPRAAGGQRWFHVYGDQPVPAADSLHWTRGQQNWNYMCAECHSTALHRGYDPAADRFNTTFSEISVGCESCHGAGSAHIAWASQAARTTDPRKGFSAAPARRLQPDWTPDPRTGSPARGVARPAGDEVETCARCHSRRGILSEDWRPGRPLEATHLPALLSEGLFEADGQMRDEVFNDQAFKQSLMYAKGVSCGDCHDPHSARLKAPGAEVCSQCHLPERFADVAHTGHTPGKGAPDCVSCHMTARTYMVVDRRHDHSFRIPRPDVSARLGTPNACNDCHRDRDPSWAAAAVERWHGPNRKGFQAWADAFSLGRAGAPEARDLLLKLARDPATPAVVRATSYGELVRFPSLAVEQASLAATKDQSPLVRWAALRSLAAMPRERRLAALLPAAADPSLAVRIEAARALADIPLDQLGAGDRASLEAAFADFEATQRLNEDRPEGRAALASFLLRRGRPADAEAELLAGLRAEPQAAALAVNLADLYRQTGREQAAEQTLRQALSLSPEAAGLRHALGLSLVRQKRYAEAMAQLRRAVALDPTDPRFAYVLAVAWQSLGSADEGRAVLKQALGSSPWDPDLLAALLSDALRRNDMLAAAPLATRLSSLQPDNPELARLSARLNGAGPK